MARFTRLAYPILAAALLLAAALPAAAAELRPAPVTLRPSVVVEDAVVRLGDLFAGPLANAATAIARAPAPGATVVLDARWLNALAQAYDVPWRPASRFEQTVVGRASQRIGPPEIRKALRAALGEHGVTGAVEVALDGGGASVQLPIDAAPTVAVRKLNFDPASGRFAALLQAPADGPALARVTVAGRVFALTEVPVPVRRLAPGEVVGKSDLEWAQVRADRLTPATVTDPARLIGKSPRHPLEPGEPIRASEVERTVIVERGKIVTVALERPRMSLTVRGRALENGAEGDVIRVMNTDSNRVVQAMVVDAGTVAVASGPAAAR